MLLHLKVFSNLHVLVNWLTLIRILKVQHLQFLLELLIDIKHPLKFFISRNWFEGNVKCFWEKIEDRISIRTTVWRRVNLQHRESAHTSSTQVYFFVYYFIILFYHCENSYMNSSAGTETKRLKESWRFLMTNPEELSSLKFSKHFNPLNWVFCPHIIVSFFISFFSFIFFI